MDQAPFSLKEITTLLVQCGALGLCAMVMLLGIYYAVQISRDVRTEIRELRDSITSLARLVVDHKARAGDPPPWRPRE